MANTKPMTSIYNMVAYDAKDNALFGRYLRNQSEVKPMILGSNYIKRIEYIVFRSRRYSIKQIYGWYV